MATTAGTPAKGMTRRQRQRISLGVQYVLLVLVIVVAASFADWGALRQNFANLDLASNMFPTVITTAMVNTVKYTALGFSFGLALGLLLALMRLSSVAPYRWVATVYV